MSHLCLFAGVTSLTLTSMGYAGSDINADLQVRLEAAEARIAELSAMQNQDWLTESRSDEIRGLVHDVLADADTRASLQGSGSPAGYNGGFTVGSGDGNWSLTINGVLQERWVYSDVDDDTLAQDSRWGFDQTRTVLNFSGAIAGSYGYDIRLDWGTSGNPSVDWAYGTADCGDGWELAMGSMKVPMSREWLINAEDQQAVERSLLSYTYFGGTGTTTSTGLSCNYSGDEARFWGMWSNGRNNGVTPNSSTYMGNANSWTLTGRLEFLLSGSGWDQFDEFTSPEGGESGTLVGVSMSYDDNGPSNLAPVSNDRWTLTADVQMEWGGTNAYLLFMYADDDVTDTNPIGFVAQSGTYLNSDWELYGRFEYEDFDDNTDNLEILTVGLNNYWAGQNAKWSTDLGYSWNGVSPLGVDATNITNWRGSNANASEWVLRTQLQFSF